MSTERTLSSTHRLRLHVVPERRRLRESVAAAFGQHGISAVEQDATARVRLVVCDESGPQCLRLVRTASRDRCHVVVALTHEVDEATSWDMIAAGASDVIIEPDFQRLALAVLHRLRRWDAVDRELESGLVRDNLIGHDAAWRDALRHAIEIAMFSSAPTLLTGATGTGKELVCQLIHALDQRGDKADLVVLDCTTVVPTLSGSEFFGHEKGAFTGASSSRDGAFALADKGTLFLDEIGELRFELQAELLRVLQEGTYKRVGGSRWQSTDFRLVCATHRDLRTMVEHGSFRSDLFHRLAANTLHLPTLAERPDDVLPLAEHFLGEELHIVPPPPFDPAMQGYLQARAYPGNVRDLRQLIARIAMRYCGAGPITIGMIPGDERPPQPPLGPRAPDEPMGALTDGIKAGLPLRQIKDLVREVVLEIVYQEEIGNGSRGAVKRTAERLDVSERLVQQWRRTRDRNGTDLAGSES